ncbi:hypothetical protein M080_7538, partial [Bacteroides fragilis str. 3397 T10]
CMVFKPFWLFCWVSMVLLSCRSLTDIEGEILAKSVYS